MTVTAVAATLGIFIGGFYGIMHIDHTQRMERKAADQCWVDGGTYTDGECKMPEDTRTDQVKVCEALNGTYVLIKNKRTGEEDFTCYDREGKEKTMPDMKDKEVIVMHDGTLVLRDKRKG